MLPDTPQNDKAPAVTLAQKIAYIVTIDLEQA
jgi:hypothetical protein